MLIEYKKEDFVKKKIKENQKGTSGGKSLDGKRGAYFLIYHIESRI